MIENIDSYIQLVLTGVCVGISLYKAFTTRSKVWILVTLFYSAFFMGSLYWQLYYIFAGVTPHIFYVSELSWYISYMFLFLFLRYQRRPDIRPSGCWIKWLMPVVAGALCIYYMTFGQIISNLIAGVLMSLIAMEAVQGLYEIKARSGVCLPAMKPVYILTLIFFFVEYALWTSSCIWLDDYSALNPYYYIDMLLSVTLLILMLVIRNALDTDKTGSE